MLAGWACADAQAPATDIAERLSPWLSAFDAIGLQAAHQSIRAIDTAAPVPASDVRPLRSPSLEDEFQRVRSTLSRSISQHFADDAGYGAYQRRHQKLQRDMEQVIAPLRDHVRQSIGRVSARLRQLAAIDAVFEHLLAAREQTLLPTVGTLLEGRFNALRLAHQQAIELAGEPDDPTRWHEPGGWLAHFRQDWSQALLAELDLRLEPTAGLIEALNNHSKKQE
jgi:hypothetical protein